MPSAAIRFAQADLQDPASSFSQPARVRSGRVLARCHAALGQHALSTAALDGALKHAEAQKLRWSASLVMAEQGRREGGGGGGAPSLGQ